MTHLTEGTYADLRTGRVYTVAPAPCPACGVADPVRVGTTAHNLACAERGERVYPR